METRMPSGRMTDRNRALLWADRRSHARYQGSILDAEFDASLDEGDSYERMVFGAFDGDMHGRPEKGSSIGRSMSARRKRRTVETEGPEVTRLPEEPPPGWAKP